jgi:hypothetical protein
VTKTSFELEITAETLVGAQAIAEEKISKFLGISADSLETAVDIEFKVKSSDTPNNFTVVVFGSVKRNVPGLTKNL